MQSDHCRSVQIIFNSYFLVTILRPSCLPRHNYQCSRTTAAPCKSCLFYKLVFPCHNLTTFLSPPRHNFQCSRTTAAPCSSRSSCSSTSTSSSPWCVIYHMQCLVLHLCACSVQFHLHKQLALHGALYIICNVCVPCLCNALCCIYVRALCSPQNSCPLKLSRTIHIYVYTVYIRKVGQSHICI